MVWWVPAATKLGWRERESGGLLHAGGRPRIERVQHSRLPTGRSRAAHAEALHAGRGRRVCLADGGLQLAPQRRQDRSSSGTSDPALLAHALAATSALRASGSQFPVAGAQDAVGRPAKIVPGLLLASTFPAIIGSTYPGAVYASQTLRFRAPCEVGRDVVAEVSVVRRVGRTARFATRCYAWDGQARGPVLVEGEAMAVLPEA